MADPTGQGEQPRVVVESRCILGEGALWDERSGTFLWVDIKKPAVWRLPVGSGAPVQLAVAEPVGFVVLTEDPDVLIAGFKSGLVRLDLKSGQTQTIVSPEPDKPGNRLNDGCVGPDGSLYFGTMDDGEAEPTGSFWRWDGRQLARFFGGFPVTNGPAVSPDGRTLYTVDSVGRVVYAHDLDGGLPGPARRFVQFEESWGHPDGPTVDAEGHVWICHWGGSRVTRFDPRGQPDRIVRLPTSQVTKCAFGGPGFSTLYITTAATGRDPREEPLAGHVFAVETGFRGVPAHLFTGAGA